MPIDGYFDVTFAEAGDVTPVPDGVQSSGSISYAQGWGPFYSQDPTVDPGTALFIDRAQTNQLFFDVTSAIQYIQQNGCAPFITTSMNGGSPYSYRKGAIASYDGGAGVQNWVSAVAANTSIPGADANWLALPADVGVLFTGGTSSGSANAQTVTTTQGGYDESVAGNIVTWKAGFSNSGPTTLNVDGSGVTSVKKISGLGLIALSAFDIVVGGEYMAITDGTTIQLLNPTNGGARQKLTANTTFYVATTGNDTTGNGSASLPWATPQHAYDYVADNVDIAGFRCFASCADGTYATGCNATTPTVGGILEFVGNTTTPANVLVSTGGTPTFAAYDGCRFAIGGFKVSGTSYLVMARGAGAKVLINDVMDYGSGGGALLGQINAFWAGYVEITHNYNITGGAGQHYYASGNGVIEMGGITVTVSGMPAFAGQFALSSSNGTIQVFGNTYSGSATGTRYLADTNATIGTNGAGANFFPGNAAGSETNGGRYT